MKISREYKIGLLFVVAIVLMVWGVNYLKGTDILSSNRKIYAVYSRVDGLLVANPVTINGFSVGQVTDIALAKSGKGEILVEMQIKNGISVPENTIAKIYSSDIMGSKSIALVLGDSENNFSDGDTLQSSIEGGIKEAVNRQVAPLKRKAENLIASIDSMVIIVQSVLNKETRDNLAQSFESIKETVDNMKHTTYRVDTVFTSQQNKLISIIDNLESITKNIDNNKEHINNSIKNFSAISDTLAQANISETLNMTNKALKEISLIMGKINSGEGTMGMLINNDTLYKNMEAATKELNLLLEDMKLHPKRYVHFSVFGKSAKKNKYVAPETSEKE
ncbi:MAG: MlaD family protein [Bacteroidota bacterium]|nr:MlaD family protein [Bacteroidota bacterium]